MRRLCSLAVAVALAPGAAPGDLIDLSGGERRGSLKPPAFVLRAEGGSDYAPGGLVGGAFSYFNADALAEIEIAAGAGFPGVQAGVLLRKLFGDGGDYLVIELSFAGNTRKRLGADVAAGRLGNSSLWTSLGFGFEHRAGAVSLGLVAGLAFISSFDLVPHGFVHGGLGLGF